MERILIILLLATISVCTVVSANESIETYTPTKKEWLEVKIGNYISGFNEFDTSIVVHNDYSINIGIYYDITQSKDKALQLKERFEEKIPFILKQYEWAQGKTLLISVYSEDRSGGGY